MMRSVWVSILLVAVFTAFLAGAVTPSNKNTPKKLIKGDGIVGDVDLDDYGPFDPTPTTKKVPPEPIQHGTPLIPYIPKTSPSPPPPPPGYEP